jgi:hypothetical protein
MSAPTNIHSTKYKKASMRPIGATASKPVRAIATQREQGWLA